MNRNKWLTINKRYIEGLQYAFERMMDGYIRTQFFNLTSGFNKKYLFNPDFETVSLVRYDMAKYVLEILDGMYFFMSLDVEVDRQTFANRILGISPIFKQRQIRDDREARESDNEYDEYGLLNEEYLKHEARVVLEDIDANICEWAKMMFGVSASETYMGVYGWGGSLMDKKETEFVLQELDKKFKLYDEIKKDLSKYE
ncbi:MAG: hypothetical protein Q4B65_01185 [Candidatus Saccharibacteria bacterium]|nr:hypothetical protein [Candidatus Saccharibacteria bacterium]